MSARFKARLPGMAAISAILVIAACDGLSFDFEFGPGNPACTVARVEGSFANMAYEQYEPNTTWGCPYVVLRPSSIIQYQAIIAAEASDVTGSGNYSILNNVRQLKRAENFLMQFTPNGNARYHEIIGAYFGATGFVPYADTVVLSLDVSSGGKARAIVSLPGSVWSGPAAIIGQTYVVADDPQQFQADVPGSPDAYEYQWSLDGSPIPGATGYVLSTMLTEGAHTVGLLIRLTDGSELNSALNVTAVTCGRPPCQYD